MIDKRDRDVAGAGGIVEIRKRGPAVVRTFLFFLAGLGVGVLPVMVTTGAGGKSILSFHPGPLRESVPQASIIEFHDRSGGDAIESPGNPVENPIENLNQMHAAIAMPPSRSATVQSVKRELTIEDMSLVELLRHRIEIESSFPFEGAAKDFDRIGFNEARENEEWQKANPYLRKNPESSTAFDLDPEGDWWVILKGSISRWSSSDFAGNSSETQAQELVAMDAYLMNRHGQAKVRMSGSPVLDRQEKRAYFFFSVLGCPDGLDQKIASFMVAAPQKVGDSVRVLTRTQGNPRYTVANVEAKWFAKDVFALKDGNPHWGCSP